MKAQKKGKLFGEYWPSAAQPAAALACTLLILIIVFLVLVLMPHQCGPKDGEVLVEGPVEVVVRDTSCNAGQGRDAGSVCVDCEPGTYNNGSFTFCQPCPVGFFANETGQMGCYQCAQGIGLTTPGEGYADADCTCARDHAPYGIPNGTCVTNANARCLCRETDAGRQTTLDHYCDDGSDNSGCFCRIAGPNDVWDDRYPFGDPTGETRWRERGCINCPRGKYKDTPGWGFCLECSDPAIPSRMEINGACVCAPGHYKAADGGCPQCPVGTYKRLASDEGNVSCIQCPPGTTTASSGAINLDECVCATGFEGFFVERGDGSSQLELQCRSCDVGYYKDTLGPSDCQPCAPGTHAPTNGTEQCRVCAAGEIAPAIGSQFCTLCLPGEFSSEPGGTKCTKCIENTYNLDYGASRCTQCADNTFAAEGSARCSDCWQNYLARSGVYLSRKGDTKLGYSVVPTLFLLIVILAFFFVLLVAYEAYRYLSGKKPPDGVVGYGDEAYARDIGVADIVGPQAAGQPGMQPMVVPAQQPHPLTTLMQMSREQLYQVQKIEQEELQKDQERIRGNLEGMQAQAQAEQAQQPGVGQEQLNELGLVHQTQSRQLEAFQALQMRSLQERHLKEQEHQMRAQQEQLDQQYQSQQQEWEVYQQQSFVEQAQQWDEFQRTMQMNQQQLAPLQPQNYQALPQYYFQPPAAPLPPPGTQPGLPPAPSMPRQGVAASLPPTSPPGVGAYPGPSMPAPSPQMPAMTPQFAAMPPPSMPAASPEMPPMPMQFAPMPPSQPGTMPAPAPVYGGALSDLQAPAPFPTVAPTMNPYGSQVGMPPAPSAFAPTQPGPIAPQQAPPQQPQTGPTDEEWQQILRQVDNM